MSRPKLVRVVEAIRSSSPPAGVRTRIIAVDGPGGAGKSTLAEYLAHELDAPIVRTDDLARWEKTVDWWAAVIEQVLRPIAAGQSGEHMPTRRGAPPKR